MYSRTSELFLEILDRPGLYDHCLSFLTPGTLFKLGRVCRRARLAVVDFANRAYDINAFLRRFVDDPVGFRSLQAQMNFLISGSAALQYLERDHYPGSDLDIYIQSEGASTLGNWLLEHGGKGYQFKPSEKQLATFPAAHRRVMRNVVRDMDDNEFHEQYVGLDIWAVFTFETPADADGNQEKIQLIMCRDSVEPLRVILNFHSSVVMNVITAYSAYSFYPKATFEERRNLIFTANSRNEKKRLAIEKYATRGWRAQSDIFSTDEMGSNPTFTFGERWVDDRHSWVLPLDMKGVKLPGSLTSTTPSLGFDPLILNSWQVTSSTEEYEETPDEAPVPFTVPIQVVRIEYATLKTIILSRPYLASGSFLPYLQCWFHKQGKFEMRRGPNGSGKRINTWWDSDLLKWKLAYLSGKLSDEQKKCRCPLGTHLNRRPTARRDFDELFRSDEDD